MIDGHINPEIIINIDISQDFPVSPILFLIYISGVFEKIKKKIPQITYLFFINNLRFIIGSKINDVVKILQKISNIIIEQDVRNTISFDIKKTKAILFTIINKNSLIKLTKGNKFSIGGKEIKFNINIIK